MLQKYEETNQVQVANSNLNNQTVIVKQRDILLSHSQELIENQFESRPKDMGELNKHLLCDILQVSKENNQEQVACQKILNFFKKTDAIQDVLFNVSLLLPRPQQLSDTYTEKNLFIKMNENCESLQRINIDLESLFSNIHDSMANYKQKLTFLCNQLLKQHDVKSDLSSFIEKYCFYFQTEFDKVKDQGKQIEQIKDQITSIRKQDEMIRLKKINQGLLDMELLNLYSFKNSKSFVALDQVQSSWIHQIKKIQELYMTQKSQINNLESNKKELSETLVGIINEKEIEDQFLKKIQQSINQKKKTDLVEDFEMIEKEALSQLEEKKALASQQLLQLNQINQDKHDKWNSQILTKIENASKISKGYNLILLVDDSGSMHQKPSNGFWRFIEKTPYRLLSESISQFIKQRKHISGDKDIISIIKFSDSAYTLCRRQNIGKTQIDLDKNPIKGGTNFDAAFEEAASLMKLQSNGMSSVLIFQTDGISQQTSNCKHYIEQMRLCDSNLMMFTLALGEEIDQIFLQDLTKFANKGNEVLNQGKANPISYFQKVLDADQMRRIFEDISLGIDEQMQELQSFIRLNQSQLDQEEERYKREIQKIQDSYNEEKSRIDQRIQQMKALKDQKGRLTYLEEQELASKTKMKDLKQKISTFNSDIQILQEKIDQEYTNLNQTNQELNQTIEQSKIEIENTMQQKFEQAKSDSKYIQKKIQVYNDIGERNEVNLMLWTKSINAFDRYLELISQFVTKLNQFFNKFKGISHDLQEKIDSSSSTSTNDIKYETQEDIIYTYFEGENSIQGVFTHIYKEQYKNHDDAEEEEVFKEALNCILSEFRNLNKFLQGMKFNNPKVTEVKSSIKNRREAKDDEEDEDEDEEQNQDALSKLTLKIEEYQKNELCEIELAVTEAAKQFLSLNIFKKQNLNKVKNKKGIQKIIEQINDFDFPEEEEEDEDESSCEDSSNDEEEKKPKSKSGQPLKNQDSKKKKVSNKKKKKIIILSEEEVKKQKNQLKAALSDKIAQIVKNKRLIDTIQHLYEALENRIEQILHQHTKSKKAEQIKIINDYIQEEIIQPLDELMKFSSNSNSK